MITQKIDLYEYFKLNRNGANGGYLTVYARTESAEMKKRLRPAMLVLPGGAYAMLSDREGESVALKFLEKGYVSFVLSYSLQTKYPTPLDEAQMAVAYIRDNAELYNVDSNHVCAVGFSAGGHLTGLLATAKSDEAILKRSIDELKPNAVILSYPVVTMSKLTHIESRHNITGGNEKLYDKLSIDKRVDENTVPAFIWHTYEDDCVPMENALMLVTAYRNNNIPFALHIFEHGPHGLSLADDETCEFDSTNEYLRFVGKWTELACDWLASRESVRGK